MDMGERKTLMIPHSWAMESCILTKNSCLVFLVNCPGMPTKVPLTSNGLTKVFKGMCVESHVLGTLSITQLHLWQ